MIITEDNAGSELRKRNPLALAYIMDTYTHNLYGLVHRILEGVGRKEDVEECVADVFITAWNRADEFDGERAPLRTWLLILAKYKALDYRRQIQRQTAALGLSEKASEENNLEDTVLAKEYARQIRHAVDALEEPDRSIFYKKYFYYESVQSIAEQLGLSKKAIENRLFRSRNLLRRKLTGFRKGDSDEGL